MAQVAVHHHRRRRDAHRGPRHRCAVAAGDGPALVPRRRLRPAVLRRGPVVDARHGRVLRAHAVVLPADGGELRVVRRVGRVPPRHPTHGRGDDRRAGARGARGGPVPPRRAEPGLAVGDADRDAARRRVLGGRVGGRRGGLGDAAATLAVARTARARDLRAGRGVLHGHTGRPGALPRRRHRTGGGPADHPRAQPARDGATEQAGVASPRRAPGCCWSRSPRWSPTSCRTTGHSARTSATPRTSSTSPSRWSSSCS